MKMRGTGSRSYDLVKHDILAVDRGQHAAQTVGSGKQMPFKYPRRPHNMPRRGISVTLSRSWALRLAPKELPHRCPDLTLLKRGNIED